VLLLAAAARGLASESPPRLMLRRTLPAEVRVPGRAPVVAWPVDGQAAVEVEGVGNLGSSGGRTPVPIASVAKVMTAYLTLLEHPLAAGGAGFTITITPADVAEEQQRAALGESTLAVRAGERITERQALEALLLPSANNVAALLAAREAGGLAAFVMRMNSTARKLGMTATTYTDPSGFDDRTVSTAVDQLRLARVALREPAFAAIVDQPSAELPLAGRVANYDALVGHDGYTGVKTGSDRAAGGCLVFAKRVLLDGRRVTILGAVLGQREGAPIEAALTSAERLGDSAAAAVRVETVLAAGTEVLSAGAADGQETTGVTASDLREIGWGGLMLPVRMLAGPRVSRLAAGERIATVAVAGDSGQESSFVASSAVGRPTFGWRLRNLL
jgi:D-alanyl-D-alanine carboxypeptidase (penicillin-binding protein 5/6)